MSLEEKIMPDRMKAKAPDRMKMAMMGCGFMNTSLLGRKREGEPAKCQSKQSTQKQKTAADAEVRKREG
ncbi:hypothetical protein KBB27_01820 [Patescibacteria group bacterium]|nr:hypothetical protein [Patescibacteria group bacterium]